MRRIFSKFRKVGVCVCVCAHVQIYRGDKFYTNGAREKTNRLEVKSLSKEEPTICNFAPYAVVRLDREGKQELKLEGWLSSGCEGP